MVKARLEADGSVYEILSDGSERAVVPRTDWSKATSFTEAEIDQMAAEDDAEAAQSLPPRPDHAPAGLRKS